MKIDGINLEVLVVVRRKGKLKFRWGKHVFDKLSPTAFGVDSQDSPRVPILVFNKEQIPEQREMFEVFFAGGHQYSPLILKQNGDIEAGTLLPEDFHEGDRILITNCPVELTRESVLAGF